MKFGEMRIDFTIQMILIKDALPEVNKEITGSALKFVYRLY